MTNNTMKFSINKEEAGIRIDIILANKITNLTRSNIKKVINSRNLKINNLTVTLASRKTKINDYIFVKLAENKITQLKPAKIKLDIIYEDKDLLVINKPVGMVVHPGAGNFEKTLVNA